ncbi:cell division protein FtsA [Buchnera aphidicola (Takecallis taiwana)]|uniref:cell division protein FtsA n=1 Tax=Buchnera aphidicola TaxID=9 RepID=UPI0031B73289
MIKKNNQIIAGIDVGTTKIVVLIGEISVNQVINIIGIGQYPSKGIDKGNINNLQSLISCIKKAIYEAETMAEYRISSIYVSLSNEYLKCKNEIGIVPIDNKEITHQDIKYAIYTAQSIKLGHDYKILHVIPQEYIIDKEYGIKNPIGLSGCRMKAKVHLITYKHIFKKNLVKAIQSCNIQVEKVVFSGIASSQAVLTFSEKQSGVCMIDIGGGSINIVIYFNGYIQYSHVLPYAGNTVTNDIAYVFNTSFQNAEIIKKKYGSTILTSLTASELIEISNLYDINTKTIQNDILIQVINSRYTELFTMINEMIIKIQNQLYHSSQSYILGSGIVLTGGGAQAKSLKILAKKIFNTQVRIGIPLKIKTYNDKIIQPNYATVIGLLKYGSKIYNHHKKQFHKTTILKKLFCYVQNWVKKII